MTSPRLLVALLSAASIAARADGPSPPQFDAQGRAVGQPLSLRAAAYEIDATLDPVKHTLVGKEHVTWTNHSDEPQATLWFHLYWNAFANDRSTFMREARRTGMRSAAPDEMTEADWGWSQVDSIVWRGGADKDVTGTLAWQHPDDDNADDRTVFTITLPEPVAPGASVTLDIAWHAQVPSIIARAGYRGSYHLVGQWFPKLGVLEVPPTRGVTSPRWNCHQYHALTEFYADFASFDVRMTVPKGFTVGATGVLVGKKDNPDGTVTWNHHQDDVHDFAWTAWDGFEVVEDRFSEPGLPEVAITLLLTPDHQAQRRQYLEAIKSALSHYGRWWLPWPYPHLTMVDPPFGAGESAGMEYPTFITVGVFDWGPRVTQEPRDWIVWDVTVHEFGHNYWYGLVASNEFEEAWLDEGINSYGTARLLAEEGVYIDPTAYLPQPLASLFRGTLGQVTGPAIAQLQLAPPASPIRTAGWRFKDYSDYSSNNYPRTELTLDTLERLVGKDTMARILKTYVERWAFRHPRADDFFHVVSEVTGADYGWFFGEYFNGTDTVDFAVERAHCEPDDPALAEGLFDDGKGGRRYVGPDEVEKREKENKKENKKEVQRCDVDITRNGRVVAPVVVRVTFDDGTARDEAWDGWARWHRWEYVGPRAIERVEVDPDHVQMLDEDLANNTRVVRGDRRLATRLGGFTTYATEALVALVEWLS